MKNDIKEIFDDLTIHTLKLMVICFDKNEMNPEEIAKHIKKLNKINRETIYIIALLCGNKKLADKIREANNIVTQERIDSFKKAVAEGTHEQFLSQIPWTEKIFLITDLDLNTSEEQQFLNIIKASISKDIEKEALRQEFSSVKVLNKNIF